MSPEVTTTHISRYRPTDPRLGRHVRHDSRSVRYAVGVLPKGSIKKVHWIRRVPILDQGDLGKCTAEALTGARGTDNAAGPGVTAVDITLTAAAASYGYFVVGRQTLDDAFSDRFYSVETRGDAYPGQWPPTDTGSDALGAMKAAQALNLVSVYRHAFSYAAAVSAIQSGALLWGTGWLQSMFDVDSRGYLSVDTNTSFAGGHELVLSGYDPATDEWILDNSWGTSWGNDGSAKIKGVQLQWLLSQNGDVTLPTWTADTPAPPAPPQPPAPVPSVTDAQFWATAQTWAAGKGFTG